MSPGEPTANAQPSPAGPAPGTLEAELLRRERQLDAVRRLGRVLGATLELDQLLPALLEEVTGLLDAERATIFLVSQDGRELYSSLAQGGQIATIRLPMGAGIAGWVAQTGRTVNIPDAYADPRFNQEVDRRSGFRTRSILCLPLPDSQGRTLGVVQALNRRGRPFDEGDEALLATVAAHAGMGLENARLYASVVRQNQALTEAHAQLAERVRELDLLVEIEREAAGSLDLDEVLGRLLERAAQLLDSEAASVLLRERGTGELVFRKATGAGAAVLHGTRLPPGAGVVGWVTTHKQPLIVNAPADDPRHDPFFAEKLGVPARGIICVPLIHASDESEDALGAFEVLNPRGGRPYDEGDLKLLTLIAGQAAAAVVLAHVREERVNSQRLASIGQLIASVMHDLRTPMTVVSGYAQMMVESEAQEERAQYAQQITKQFELMAAMTREVLLFARGQSNLLVRKVYVGKFVDDLREQLERTLAGGPVKVVVEGRYGGTAHFDELKLYRLAHNLAINARQAIDGPGTLTVVVERVDDELVLSFADTGRGIPEAVRGRLFQAFASHGKRDGTGLGLAMVKKIVDEHGGRITYDTTAGQGTTFRVALPIAPRD